ncbi:DUF1045 domain-containing protein [Rhodobacteraceae bacterium N5(2021)]|uniref:DUF1045 domain-containing protein n=1 Tax=Gymnodinialimonas phycosphaerae TaxID=2841589 RepID=A0A975TR62_9RHOB|nr:DUF1045 domain-containing protein [Gymnodinialimonas phycosphaerae]MBY4893503.1 DUF1045 domain-containing protein [Gymnodinialimonas phycosphaerae]
MDEFKRFGLYVVPQGALFDAASAWLGWNSATGQAVPHPNVAGLPEPVEVLAATPRSYGFHGTIKPPFVMADGQSVDALHDAAADFCATQAPVTIPSLAVRRLGGFVAIVPADPSPGLATLAAAAVEALDTFRARPSETELAKRRKAGLSDRQEALLQKWGYPYVMDEFQFHMTLTGRADHAEAVRDVLARHFAPVLPSPFEIESLALMGEDPDGRFHLLHRYTLAG